MAGLSELLKYPNHVSILKTKADTQVLQKAAQMFIQKNGIQHAAPQYHRVIAQNILYTSKTYPRRCP